MKKNWGRWFNNKTSPTLPVPSSVTELTSNTTQKGGELGSEGEVKRMDQDDSLSVDYVQIIPFDTYDFQRAKQRASLKWLLSKAYNHKPPQELAEPFYKDHEGEEHLKPHIVKGLSDAELYCLALCNLYADPNYSQLSPWGIVQALARKGIYVQPIPDIQLTETVLIQNRPLRMVAHMAVLEAMMSLQVKEIISADRMVNTVQRYGPPVHPREMPSDHEEAFILWINRSIIAIKDYITNNNSREHTLSSLQVESWKALPLFHDLSDLSDGIGLSALLAFYCQDDLSLSEITLPSPGGDPLNVSECLWNLQLIQRTCRESLPFNVCHFNFEDILYFHDSMKQNMLSFLADLYNQVELNPSCNVKQLGSQHPQPIRPGLTGEGVMLRRGLIHQSSQIRTIIPDLRPSLYSSASLSERNVLRSHSATSTPKRQLQTSGERNRKSTTHIFLGDGSSGKKSPPSSAVSVPIRRSGTPIALSDRSNHKEQRYYANSSEDSEEFVVHRGRNVPTLSQVIRSVSPSSQEERSSPGSRMTLSRNVSMMDGEDSGMPAAGRPSNLGANKTSYAGRRSRRNSFSEADSQLTVENFGGSQDNLNRFVIGKNPDKQPAVLTDTDPSSSPIRYPKKSSTIESPEFHSESSGLNNNGKDSTRPPSSSSQDTDPMPFHGRKKQNYAFESGECGERYERGRDPERHREELPSFRPREPPQSNITLYMMNEGGGGFEGPMRSASLSNLSRLSDLQNKPVNIVYLGSGSNGSNGYGDVPKLTDSRSNSSHPKPHSNVAPPPQVHHYRSPSPQSSHSSPPSQSHGGASVEDGGEEDDTDELAAQLANIRLKLEEKRKRIETEKGRMESAASKNQFKIGKAAYLKAMNKEEMKSGCGRSSVMGDSLDLRTLSKTKQLTLKDLESKWLHKTEEPCRTPEIENMDLETYQKSLAKMDTSLTELESDIGRLTAQQEQIQRQFFLHGDDGSERDSSRKRTWTAPPVGNSGSRTYWSPPRIGGGREEGGAYWDPPPTTRLHDFNGDSSPYISIKSSAPQPLSGWNATNGTSSFRLHSKADSQGNRLFTKQSGGDGEGEGREEEDRPTPPPRQRTIHTAPFPTPPPDDMEPQSVCFVQEDNPPVELPSLASSKKSLQITSGSKTYRITPESGSPPRPSANRLFNADGTELSLPTSEENPSLGERGFYIPLDPETPVRPKPPLRTKSPAKRSSHTFEPNSNPRRDLSSEYVSSIVDRVPIPATFDKHDSDRVFRPNQRPSFYRSPQQKSTGELVLDEKQHLDSSELDLMEKKKEKILLQSLRRQHESEETRRVKEMELHRRKEEEGRKEEEKLRKREEEKARKQAILESYRIKKSEEMEKEGKGWEVQENTKRFLRPKSGPATSRPRPKTIHLTQVDSGANSYGNRVGSGMLRRSDSQTSSSALGRTSTTGLYSGKASEVSVSGSRNSVRDPWGSTSSLNQDNRRRGVNMYDDRRSRSRPRELSTSRLEVRGRQGGYGMGSTDYLPRGNSTSSLMDGLEIGIINRSVGGGNRDSSSGVGTSSTPPTRRSSSPPSLPRRTPLPSPTTAHPPPLPSLSTKLWPGSLPPGLMSRRSRFDDGASDISSVASSNMDYSGLRLYKQPTAKSNRGIIMNAVEYCVFPGVVNRDAKVRVIDEVNRSESKHFLLMFRDAGCQFRALYTYVPETDEIVKLYGVGPRQVNDSMFEKFFKYNSGGKCFSQVHTKHLTVTIDAFTIHNALWQGKKAPTAKTKDMALVI